MEMVLFQVVVGFIVLVFIAIKKVATGQNTTQTRNSNSNGTQQNMYRNKPQSNYTNTTTRKPVVNTTNRQYVNTTNRKPAANTTTKKPVTNATVNREMTTVEYLADKAKQEETNKQNAVNVANALRQTQNQRLGMRIPDSGVVPNGCYVKNCVYCGAENVVKHGERAKLKCYFCETPLK